MSEVELGAEIGRGAFSHLPSRVASLSARVLSHSLVNIYEVWSPYF